VQVHIYVRRGGPGYEQGLEMMRKFSRDTGVFVDVNGPETNMVAIVHRSLERCYPERMRGKETIIDVKLGKDIVSRAKFAHSTETSPVPLFNPETTCIVYALRSVVIQVTAGKFMTFLRPYKYYLLIMCVCVSWFISACLTSTLLLLVQLHP
jgi:hypothetical protein